MHWPTDAGRWSRVTTLLATAAILAASTASAIQVQVPPVHLARRAVPEFNSNDNNNDVAAPTHLPFIVPNAFIAEFKSPVHDEAGVNEDHRWFRREVATHEYALRERVSLKRLVNAISFEASPAVAEQLTQLPMIKAVWPMVAHSRPRVQAHVTPNNNGLKYAHDMTGVDRVRQRLQNSGAGTKVGIVDSGVDYTHPALGGCFGVGCRIAFGHDFVGDGYLGNGRSQPQPDTDPRDICNGHGTHVAGIIAANDPNFQGVAPHAILGAYRVFGCRGSTETDLLVAAMEMAHRDGMDVVNMSLGGGSSWAEYPDAAAAEQLARRGVVVVASMGNDGDKGMWEASAPGLAPNVISVGSVDSMKYQAYGLRLDADDESPIEYMSEKETPLNFTGVGIVSAAHDGDEDDTACSPLDRSVSAKVVLARRGNCTFVAKANFAKQAGALAVIVYNNVDGEVFIPSVADNSTLRVVAITQHSGKHIRRLLRDHDTLTVTFPSTMTAFDNPNGGRMSRFSSYGPGPELDLKPDVTAPGGLIRSTYPVPLGSYRTLSGTSMSSPYVAGAAALYIAAQTRKHTNLPSANQAGPPPNNVHRPHEVRERFQATARFVVQANRTDGALASVARQGAGLLDIEAAINATTLLSPAHVGLNDSHHGIVWNSADGHGSSGGHRLTLALSNPLPIPLEYVVRHYPALAIQGYNQQRQPLSVPQIQRAPAIVTVRVAQSSIEVAKKKKEESVGVGVGSGGSGNRMVEIIEPASTSQDRFSASSSSSSSSDSSSNDEDRPVNELRGHHRQRLRLMGRDNVYQEPAKTVRGKHDTDEADEDRDARRSDGSHGEVLVRLSVDPHSDTTLALKIDPPNALPDGDRWVYSGFISVENDERRERLHTSYIGLKGELPAQPILDREGFPRLAWMVTAKDDLPAKKTGDYNRSDVESDAETPTAAASEEEADDSVWEEEAALQEENEDEEKEKEHRDEAAEPAPEAVSLLLDEDEVSTGKSTVTSPGIPGGDHSSRSEKNSTEPADSSSSKDTPSTGNAGGVSGGSAANTTQHFLEENSGMRLKLRVRLIHPTRTLRVDVVRGEEGENNSSEADSVGPSIGILPNAWITYMGRHSGDRDDYSIDFTFDGNYTPLSRANKVQYVPNMPSDLPFSPRNAAANSSDMVHSSGTSGGKVEPLPDGFYFLRVQALRPFGDEDRLQDWDTWQSQLLHLSTVTQSPTANSALSMTIGKEEETGGQRTVSRLQRQLRQVRAVPTHHQHRAASRVAAAEKVIADAIAKPRAQHHPSDRVRIGWDGRAVI